jgi:prepilin-type N-terminal cleavage/methylation domain-containing protein
MRWDPRRLRRRLGRPLPGGFTAIELLVVMAMVAIVALITVPWLMCSFDKSRYTRTLEALRQARALVDSHESELGVYPVDLATAFGSRPVPEGITYCTADSDDAVCTDLGVSYETAGYVLRTEDEISRCSDARIVWVQCCGAEPMVVPWGEELAAPETEPETEPIPVP